MGGPPTWSPLATARTQRRGGPRAKTLPTRRAPVRAYPRAEPSPALSPRRESARGGSVESRAVSHPEPPAPRYRVEEGRPWADVYVERVAQIFDKRDPAPFRTRDLDPDLVDYLRDA